MLCAEWCVQWCVCMGRASENIPGFSGAWAKGFVTLTQMRGGWGPCLKWETSLMMFLAWAALVLNVLKSSWDCSEAFYGLMQPYYTEMPFSRVCSVVPRSSSATLRSSWEFLRFLRKPGSKHVNVLELEAWIDWLIGWCVVTPTRTRLPPLRASGVW